MHMTIAAELSLFIRGSGMFGGLHSWVIGNIIGKQVSVIALPEQRTFSPDLAHAYESFCFAKL
jgi:hypothetical protein